MDNQILAGVIVKNRLAAPETVENWMKEVSSSEDIAQVLARVGIIGESLLSQIYEIAAQQESSEPELSIEGNNPFGYSTPTPVEMPPLETIQGLEPTALSEPPGETDSAKAAPEIAISSSSISELPKMADTGVPAQSVEIEIPVSPQASESSVSLLWPDYELESGYSSSVDIQAVRSCDEATNMAELLLFLRRVKGSDLYVGANGHIFIRRYQKIVQASQTSRRNKDWLQWIETVAGSAYLQFLVANKQAVTVLAVPGAGRFRLLACLNSLGSESTESLTMAIRPVLRQPATLKQQGVPWVPSGRRGGLRIISGGAGQGKTSLLFSVARWYIENTSSMVHWTGTPVEAVLPEVPGRVIQYKTSENAFPLMPAGLHQSSAHILFMDGCRLSGHFAELLSLLQRGITIWMTSSEKSVNGVLAQLYKHLPSENMATHWDNMLSYLEEIHAVHLVPGSDKKSLHLFEETLLNNHEVMNLLRNMNPVTEDVTLQKLPESDYHSLDKSLILAVRGDVISQQQALQSALNPHALAERFKGEM